MANTQTPVTLDEGRYTGEFLVSEANGMRSRETGVFDGAGAGASTDGVWHAGQVVELHTGKWSPVADAAPAGKTLGILLDNVRDPAGDWDVVVAVRDCEVNDHDLVLEGVSTNGQAIKDELATAGIVVRYTRSTN